MNITWDADKYTKDFSFVHQYGDRVAELLDCPPGSRVVDLGCGNGALTERLRERGFQVVGIDASGELLETARKSWPEIRFIQGDAADFALEEPADAVFSNAVFHWIEKEKHPRMLRCVCRALKPRGQFVFEFGGQGNNRLIHRELETAFQEHGYSYQMPFYFPGIGEYAPMVEAAGFQVRAAVLFDRFTELKGDQGLKDWIRMFIKTPFQTVPDPDEQEEIIDTAVDRLKKDLYRDGKWYADYVRLRMKARRI